jgi:hypothetical protein
MMTVARLKKEVLQAVDIYKAVVFRTDLLIAPFKHTINPTLPTPFT